VGKVLFLPTFLIKKVVGKQKDVCPPYLAYARSEKGKRAKCENSITPGTRVSTVGALGINGLLAEFCYEGTMTAAVFKAYVEQILVPILLPSNVVILDNARVHYDEDAIAMIETTGAGVLYLPPYSPELNPFEV
jgi:hypothetical protein